MKKIIAVSILSFLCIPVLTYAFAVQSPNNMVNVQTEYVSPNGTPYGGTYNGIYGGGGGQLSQIDNVNSLSTKLAYIGNLIIQILIAFAVIYIIFNVIHYIMKADSPEDRKPIGTAILWGIVGLFVILSIWGLVNILLNTFNTGKNAPNPNDPNYPRANIPPPVTI